jgi:CxxC motif-containing protein
MEEMICITCPMGCHLSVQRLSASEISVTGNRCARGEAYAREELLSPKRVVTTTCGIAASGAADGVAEAEASKAELYRPRRVPVRTKSAFPKERVTELLGLLSKVTIALPVRRGQVILADVLGTGVDVVATRSM